jgi:tight adherence protein B
MDKNLLPILAAAAVMLLVFGAWRVIATVTDPERRKLKERLTASGTASVASSAQLQITLQSEAQGLAALLTQWSFFDKIQRSLVHAYPDMTLMKFVGIALGIGAFTGLCTLAITQSPAVSAVALAIGVYMPCIWLGNKKAKRQKMLAEQLPDALDFLGRILKAGHSLSTGVQMMADELPKPLAQEFRKAYDQHTLGMSLEDCLKEIAKRIESTDFAFFVTAVLIQRQTGGDLSEVLGNISGMIRDRIRLQQHVKAKTAEGRFTGYILAAFPAVMFVIAYTLNPTYAGVLINTTKGLMLLGGAFGLQMLGLYSIKKITTVTV